MTWLRTVAFRIRLQEYEIGIGKQLTNYEIANLKIKGLFRLSDAKIDRSIWPENENEKILLFYQGAFDLAEEVTRKAQTELEQKLFRKIFPCKGKGNLKNENLLKKMQKNRLQN